MNKPIDLNQNELMLILTALQHQKTFLDRWLRAMCDETAAENMRFTQRENCKLQLKIKQALGLEQ